MKHNISSDVTTAAMLVFCSAPSLWPNLTSSPYPHALLALRPLHVGEASTQPAAVLLALQEAPVEAEAAALLASLALGANRTDGKGHHAAAVPVCLELSLCPEVLDALYVMYTLYRSRVSAAYAGHALCRTG